MIYFPERKHNENKHVQVTRRGKLGEGNMFAFSFLLAGPRKGLHA
jgi:hypothetical protein